MNRILHYTKDREFTTDEGDLLCYVNFNGYITVYYSKDVCTLLSCVNLQFIEDYEK